MENKVCKLCKQNKPVSEFDLIERLNRLRAYCKICWDIKYQRHELTAPIISTIEGEEWKDVLYFEGFYKVSTHGRVFAFKRENSRNYHCRHDHLLSLQSYDKDGYLKCALHKDGKAKHVRIHVLVAKAFIPNPESKPEVNHLDGNKENNHYLNLEWATRSEQEKHAFRVLGKIKSALGRIGSLNKNSIPVIQLNMDYSFVKEWGSAGEAALITGIANSGISATRCKRKDSYGNYRWMYKEDYEIFKMENDLVFDRPLNIEIFHPQHH